MQEDLNETFKILTGRERIDSSKFFELAGTTSGLQGHALKLYKQRCCTTVRQCFFSSRVINSWNSNRLPEDVVEATCSKTVWTSNGKIWASTADWLCSSSSPSTSISICIYKFDIDPPLAYTLHMNHLYVSVAMEVVCKQSAHAAGDAFYDNAFRQCLLYWTLKEVQFRHVYVYSYLL